jgi:peptidoglycan hydrolase-like protein with peptidoglycan-binding domain
VSRRAAGLVAALLAAAACSRTQQVRESERKAEEAPEEGGSGAGLPPEPGRPRIPASPQALLGEGAVGELQRALAGRGLLRGHREGALDGPTAAALRRFQAERGLAATGFPDRETLKDLGIDPEGAYLDEGDRRRTEGEDGGGRRQGRRGDGRP